MTAIGLGAFGIALSTGPTAAQRAVTPFAVNARPGWAKHGTFLLSLPPVRQVGIRVRPG